MFKYCPFCGQKLIKKAKSEYSCCVCAKHIYLNSKPTVAIVPIYQDEMLMSIRGLDPFKGELDTIGGFLENGESPIDGALREFKEETDVQLKKSDLKYLGHYMSDGIYEGVKYEMLNIAFVVELTKKIKPTALSDVVGFRWIPLQKKISYYHKYISEIQNDLRKSFSQ